MGGFRSRRLTSRCGGQGERHHQQDRETEDAGHNFSVAGGARANMPGMGAWSVCRTLVIAVVLPVGAWAQSGPSINPGGVINAASSTAGAPVAPGSIVSAYGSFLLASPAGASGAPLPDSLGGLSLQFTGGIAAPLFYASSGQVNLQVPWETANQSQTSLTATFGGQISAPETVSLAPFAPGIFAMNSQGTGQGAILNTSYQLVDASHPATPGTTYIQIYCTGLGPVTNQPADGVASPASPPAETITIPQVTIGGVAATVTFAGLAPGFVGEYQVNALMPAAAPVGQAVPVTISIGGAT